MTISETDNEYSTSIRKLIIERKYQLMEISFILLIGLTVLNWFDGDYYIKTLDSLFSLNPNVKAFEKSFIWNDSFGLGAPIPGLNTSLLYHFHAMLMNTFGLIVSQKMMFYLLFTTPILSFWFFSYYLLPTKGGYSDSFSRVIPSIFYVANPFTMSFIWWHHMLLIFFWIAFPLILLFIIRVIQSKNRQQLLRNSFVLALIFLLLAPGLNLLTFSILSFASIVLILSLRLLRQIKIKTTHLLVAAGFVFLINAWYIIPYFVTINEQLNLAQQRIDASSEAQFITQSKYSTLPNTLRLLGFQTLYLKHFQDSFYEWAPSYLNNPPSIVLSVLVPSLSFLALLFIKRMDARAKGIILAFSLLLLIGIFLQKQGAQPFGEINQSLLELPFGDAFRHAYDKFAIIVILSFAVLLYFSLTTIFSMMKRNLSKIIAFLLILAVLIGYSYPVWNGQVIFDEGNTIPSHKIIIPNEYYEFGEFMSDATNNKTFVRIAALPTTFWGEAAYKWEKGIQPNSDPLLDSFLDTRFSILQFRTSSPYGNEAIAELEESLTPYNEDIAEYVDTVASLGVEYIVFHRDWDDNFVRYLPPTKYYESLLNGYSDFGELNGKASWRFNGMQPLVLNNPNLSGSDLHIEMLTIVDNTSNSQTVMKLGTFKILLTERNEVYVNFYTQNGYRWSSPIKVDFIKTGIPLRIGFHYSSNSDHAYFDINGIRYEAKLNGQGASTESSLSPINLNGDFMIGGDNSNNFIGDIYFVKITSQGSTYEFLPDRNEQNTIPIYIFESDVIPITKLYSNDKLSVYMISDAEDIVSVDKFGSARIESVERINPSLWQIKMDVHEPVALSFIESYDNQWEARIYKEDSLVDVVSPDPDQILSRFSIDQIGSLDITLRYKPQEWSEIASVVSAVAFGTSFVYLFIGIRKIKQLSSLCYSHLNIGVKQSIIEVNQLRASSFLIVTSLVLLILLSFVLIQKDPIADQIATATFLLLIIGIVWKFARHLKEIRSSAS